MFHCVLLLLIVKQKQWGKYEILKKTFPFVGITRIRFKGYDLSLKVRHPTVIFVGKGNEIFQNDPVLV